MSTYPLTSFRNSSKVKHMATNDLRHAENRGRKAAKLATTMFKSQLPASDIAPIMRPIIENHSGVKLPVSDETWHTAIGIYRELLRFYAENVPSSEDDGDTEVDGDSMEELFEGRH